MRTTTGNDVYLGDDGKLHVRRPPKRHRLIEWGRTAWAAIRRGMVAKSEMQRWRRG